MVAVVESRTHQMRVWGSGYGSRTQLLHMAVTLTLVPADRIVRLCQCMRGGLYTTLANSSGPGFLL